MVSRIDDHLRDPGPGPQLACIIARPEVLERLLVAQEQLARTQTIAADCAALQIVALRRCAYWSFISLIVSVAALVAVAFAQ